MRPAPAYPATLYQPAPLVDLSSPPERARLSPAAVRGFFNIMRAWRVRDAEARELLGGMSNGAFYALKKNPEGKVLDQDTLTRVSLLIGIFKALNVLHGRRLADEWVRLPNSNRIFAGRAPLDYMRRGGTPAMQTVRRLLDARRGGR